MSKKFWTFDFHIQKLIGPLVKYGVRSLEFFWAPVYSRSNWPRNSPPPPAFGLIYDGAIGQPR